MALRNTRRKSGGSDAPAKTGRSFHRGAEGRARTAQELEKQEQRRKKAQEGLGREPLRFFMYPGESREIVILDEEPDFFRYEHNVKDPASGKYKLFTGCVREWDDCPVCDAYGEPYYALYLSVLDLSPYENKRGETIEWTRKLMCVKPSQQKKFMRKFEKEGTLRGAIFEMNRDGDKDAAIGNDIELLEFMEEDELAEYVREWTDRDGKTHVEDCSVPFEYEKVFEEPTAEELAATIGVRHQAAPGSRRGNKEALEGEDDADGAIWDKEEEEEEPAPRRSRAKTKPGRRGATRRRAVDDDEVEADVPEEEDVDEGESEEEVSERPARRARSARPAARGATAKATPAAAGRRRARR